MTDTFTTHGIEPALDIDVRAVEARHRELSRALHPDRFSQAPANERRMALSRAIEVNEAWRAIRDPIKRGEALFRYIGVPGGETAYAIPEMPTQQFAPEDHLRRVFGDWVVELDRSGDLVVLRTPPGSAHVVGSALDRSGLPDVVGTVAGDDTVLVIATERRGPNVAAALVDLAGL